MCVAPDLGGSEFLLHARVRSLSQNAVLLLVSAASLSGCLGIGHLGSFWLESYFIGKVGTTGPFWGQPINQIRLTHRNRTVKSAPPCAAHTLELSEPSHYIGTPIQ